HASSGSRPRSMREVRKAMRSRADWLGSDLCARFGPVRLGEVRWLWFLRGRRFFFGIDVQARRERNRVGDQGGGVPDGLAAERGGVHALHLRRAGGASLGNL